MKAKKTVIAVLTAALITAFFIGCNVLPDDTNLNSGRKQYSSDGKTRVRISLGGTSNGRTILPDVSYYDDVEKFPFFSLLVYDSDDDPVDIVDLDPDNEDFLDFFEYAQFSNALVGLSDGEYTFYVFASNEDKDEYLAWGMTKVEVEDGETEVKITLKEINADDGTFGSDLYVYDSGGKFAWNLNVSEYETAELKLNPLVNATYTGLTVDLTSNTSGTEDIYPSGYYLMVIELGKTNYQTVFVREVVHIWSGFTSTYNKSLPELRSTLHKVVLTYDGETVNGSSISVNVVAYPSFKNATHGTTFGAFLSNTNNSNVDITTPVDADGNYFFKQWQDVDVANGTALSASKYVLQPTTLYAKWIAYKVPEVSHYNITGSAKQTVGHIGGKNVEVKNDGGTYSDGAVTIYYQGISGTSYDKSSTLPNSVGTYAVTFDVAAGSVQTGDDRWKAVTGLSAGTLTIVEPQMFVIELEWTDELKPTFTSNTAIYDESTGKLTINIVVDNTDNKFSSFEWFVDFDSTSTVLGSSSILDLTFDIENDDVGWFMIGKEFTITLTVNGIYSGTVTFTPLITS